MSCVFDEQSTTYTPYHFLLASSASDMYLLWRWQWKIWKRLTDLFGSRLGITFEQRSEVKMHYHPQISWIKWPGFAQSIAKLCLLKRPNSRSMVVFEINHKMGGSGRTCIIPALFSVTRKTEEQSEWDWKHEEMLVLQLVFENSRLRAFIFLINDY